MKKKLLVLFVSLFALVVMARPLVSVSLDAFGFALSVRSSEQVKFHPVIIVRR